MDEAGGCCGTNSLARSSLRWAAQRWEMGDGQWDMGDVGNRRWKIGMRRWKIGMWRWVMDAGR